MTIENCAEGHCELSVVVPVLNEEGQIQDLIERTIAVLDQSEVSSFEVLIVDDGSTDNTATIVKKQRQSDPRIKLIRLSRNFGQESAVQAGFLHSRGDWILQMDGDLQNPPEEIPKLLAERKHGFDVIWGLREERQDPWLRKKASRLLTIFMRKVMNIALPKDVTTFRLIRSDIARFVARLPEKKKFLSALIIWTGFQATGVPVRHAARGGGETKYNLAKLVNHTLDLIVGFSIRPLRLIGIIGGFVALGGLGYGFLRIIQKLLGVPVEMGFTSLMSSITILGGLNLIMLAIVGEYVGRIFVQLQDRPLYIIKECLGVDAAPAEDPLDAKKANDNRLRLSATEPSEILQE